MKKYFLTIFMALFFIMPLINLASPENVLAAGPKCFKLSGNPAEIKAKPCSEIKAPAERLLGHKLKNNFCYLLGWGAFEEPANSPKCEEWKSEGGSGGDGGGGGGTLNAFSTNTKPVTAGDTCGDPGVDISINIGCRGKNNPIVDMTFAFIRFLSVGVGVVAVGSIVLGGVQYTASAGDPKKTAAAINRISSTLIALLIYFLIFAILNWLVPSGIFK